MTITKYCNRNAKCQLWQMLCDGNPCLVEKEIGSTSNCNSILSSKTNRMWNSKGFKSTELLELAVKIEKAGYQLYKRLAKKTSNEQLRNLLSNLALGQKRHMLKLREQNKKITLSDETSALDYHDFVRTTIETHIFNGTDEIRRLAENAKSVKDVLDLASHFEKDTLIFLGGLNNLIADKDGVLADLITEQQTHLIELTKLGKEIVIGDNSLNIRPKRYPRKQTASEIA